MTTQYIIECFVGALNDAEMPVFYVAGNDRYGNAAYTTVRGNAKRFDTLAECQDYITAQYRNGVWGTGIHAMVRPIKA